MENEKAMSRELQERADRITEELKEALVPLRYEIKKLKNTYRSPEDENIIIHKRN